MVAVGSSDRTTFKAVFDIQVASFTANVIQTISNLSKSISNTMHIPQILSVILTAATLATAGTVDITFFSSQFCNANSTTIAEFKLNPAGNGGCIAWSTSKSFNLIVQAPGCSTVTFYTDGACTVPTATDIMDADGNWNAGCQTFEFPIGSFNTQCN